eukprot:Skav207303  [mRNA]  locus=scaffold533:113701:114535:- [translate_table: standard]
MPRGLPPCLFPQSSTQSHHVSCSSRSRSPDAAGSHALCPCPFGNRCHRDSGESCCAEKHRRFRNRRDRDTGGESCCAERHRQSFPLSNRHHRDSAEGCCAETH